MHHVHMKEGSLHDDMAAELDNLLGCRRFLKMRMQLYEPTMHHRGDW